MDGNALSRELCPEDPISSATGVVFARMKVRHVQI